MVARHLTIPISDESQIGEARRSASRLAEEAGLGETDCGKAAIIATELATNLVRHAKGGEVLVRSLNGESRGVEILSIDRGPGVADIQRCLEDGYSTRGTAGNGLGAVQRLSTHFEINSAQPDGTVVLSRIFAAQPAAQPSKASQPYAWSAINRPAPGEHVSGDAWRLAEGEGVVVLMMVDGLGHGPEAAKAAEAATNAFETDPFGPPTVVVDRIDRLMRGTRGGALAIARVDLQSQMVKYVGVGNIVARLKSAADEPSRGLVSHNGTVGVQVRKVQEFEYPLPANGVLVMHSDGLQQRWTFDKYAGWPNLHPATLAGLLYRDHTRGRDDVTVAVLRTRLSA